MDNILTIYICPDNSIAHVWREAYTPDAEATFFMNLNADTYPVEAAYFTGSTDNISVINGEIYQGETLVRDAAWVATAQAGVDALLAAAQAQADLLTTFGDLQSHLPALKVLQEKLLGYSTTYGADPDNFSGANLDTIYADLKAAFVAYPYWLNRLKLFIKRRGIVMGSSLSEVNALLARITAGTETTADKALLWEAADILISLRVASILGVMQGN